MRAPTSHMIKDTPTLPEDRRMLLGVAYILFQRRWSARVHLPISKIHDNSPGSYHRIEDKKSSTDKAYGVDSIKFQYHNNQ